MLRSRVTRLVSVSLLATTLVACGAAGGDNGGAGGEGPVTISFSNWQFAEPGRGDALKGLIEDFNDSQDEVRVKAVTIPYPRYADTIMTQLGAGSGPDVMNMDHDVWVLAQQNGLLSEITDQVEEPAAGFVEGDSNNIVDGGRYGVVWETLNYALILNEDLLEEAGVEAPETYEEFEAAAQQLTMGDEQFGFAFRNTMPEQTGWWFDLSNWVYGHGGTWTTESGEPTINSPEVIEAVGKYQEFFANNYVPQGADAATYRRMFWEGQVAMTIDNMAVPSIFMSENPDLNLKVVPNPFPEPTNAMIVEQIGVNAASEKQEAAIKFVNYLLEPETQANLIEALNGSGVGTKVDPPAQVKESIPWLDTYNRASEHGLVISPEGAKDKTADIRLAVLTEVDKVLRQSKDPETAMNDAQAAVEEILS
jgi:multiple sugar transport system substrate-binding protein